jgi:type IV pilus assembly protein PilB
MTDGKGAGKQDRKSGEQSDPTLYQMLNQDVSWHSIRDLMSYEISFNHAEHDAGPERAGTDGEGPDIEETIGNMMVDRGILNDRQLEQAREQSSKTGQPFWRAVMQAKPERSATLYSFLNTPLNELFRGAPDEAFCNWLLENDVLTVDTLKAARKAARASDLDLPDELRRRGDATDEQIAEGLAVAADLPYESLADVDEIPSEVLSLVPPQILLAHNALPLSRTETKIRVAFAAPTAVDELGRLGLMLEREVDPCIAPREALQNRLQQLFLIRDGKSETFGTPEASKSLPTAELIASISRGLLRAEGTDIHVEPQKSSARIRYRVDGVLHDVLSLGLDDARRLVTSIKSQAGMDITQPFLPGDGHLAISLGDNETATFRISTIPTINGEKMAMRWVQSEMAFSSFANIGMTGRQEALVRELLALPNGLVMTCGPVGSGKTTTLYSCINSMDCFNRNICTIEDPVEFEVAGINQVQVNEARGLDFATTLRSMLRQDPDTILVGEIRDEETAAAALRAALTGTLVLSTIHANSAATAINALIYLGCKPFLVANATAAIIFQRLIRRVCDECREEYEAESHDLAELGIVESGAVTLARGRGCRRCFHTGYHGRTGVYEILTVDAGFREVIVSSARVEELEEAALASGMVPLASHARELVLEGVTTVEEYSRII